MVEQRTENPRVTGSIPVLGIFFIRFSLNLLYNDKQSTAKFFAYSIFLLWIEQMTSARFILDVRKTEGCGTVVLSGVRIRTLEDYFFRQKYAILFEVSGIGAMRNDRSYGNSQS